MSIHLKKITTIVMLLAAMAPLFAQESDGTIAPARFRTSGVISLRPYDDTGRGLARLTECGERNSGGILGSRQPFFHVGVDNDLVPTERVMSAVTDRTSVEATDSGGFAVRANLLRWATLTPDIGVEWRIDRSWSIGVGGSWSSWQWDAKNRRYALWEVVPEVRCYLGVQRRGYLGVMFKVGAFNYKFGTIGRQGDLLGGGITGGYVVRLSRCLDLDFNIGLGSLHADFDKYAIINDIRMCCGSETSNWWGPVHAGVSLKWNLF